MTNVIDFKKILADLTPVNQPAVSFQQMSDRMTELRAEIALNTDMSQRYLDKALAFEAEYDKLADAAIKSAIEEL